MVYHTTVENDHERDEELQWARILRSGNEPVGLAVVFIQKLCTAFHEFDPAVRAGMLRDDEASLGFFRGRLGGRIGKVLDVLAANGMDRLGGSDELRSLLDRCNTAKNLHQLAALAEEVHRVNHTLTDALEKLLPSP